MWSRKYFTLQEQHRHLSPQRAIFWEEEKALIRFRSAKASGEGGSFPKAGITVPAGIVQEDLFRLQQLITHYLPDRTIIVRDMFHKAGEQ